MTNLPDDWNAYFRTCEDCGARYHLSGTDECECPTCDNCHEVTAESNMDDERDGWCSKCADRAREDTYSQLAAMGADAATTSAPYKSKHAEPAVVIHDGEPMTALEAALREALADDDDEPVGAPTPHIRRTPRRVALKHLETLRMWADEEGAP